MYKGKFRWQRGYGGFSVSVSQLETVKRYIENQEEHHRKNFDEEYQEWVQHYGVHYKPLKRFQVVLFHDTPE